MSALFEIILPVFIVLGLGYLARWRGLMSDEVVDALMKFTQGFAIPCLLFRAISTLDLGHSLDPALLASFYAGAVSCFLAGIFGARYLFGRPWEDATAIGFCALFSNALLLGLPITERAYGSAALQGNYAILAFHSPFCYCLGITLMEVIRARGAPARELPAKVLKAMFSNGLIVGISLGAAVNLTGLPMPGVLTDALDLLGRAALPAALFGLGGVLYRYRPEGDLRTIFYVCLLSLVVHPAIVWTVGSALGLERDAFRSAVLTASMAPGVNTYVFANIYGTARRVAASAVLMGTALSLLSIALWLLILP